MKKYERPVVMVNEELAEGVYAASGATCYLVDGFGCQKPYSIEGTNMKAWTVHVDGEHNDPGHHSSYREVTIVFNYPVWVEKYESNTTLISGDGTNTIVVSLNHHNGFVDTIGLSGLVVKVDKSITDLRVVSAKISNCNMTCGCFNN